MMKSDISLLIKLLSLQCLIVLSVSHMSIHWPGSYCDSKQGCCYPKTGKPAADFLIRGFWPNNNDGSFPSNCGPDSPFDDSTISDLESKLQSEWPTLACPSGDSSTLWRHEWERYGTCSESELGQYDYFAAALRLKNLVNLLHVLTSAGIKPNGQYYSLDSIKSAIKEEGTGFTPHVECNVDSSGNRQLYQVYFCVDNSASGFIECPIFPRGKCGSSVEFPTFEMKLYSNE